MKSRYLRWLALPLLWVVAHLIWVSVDGLRARAYLPADVAVVLGNAVLANGQPAPRTEARCRKALELYQAGLVKAIVTSGGYDGAVQRDEATVMRDFLISRGVTPRDVIADSLGVDSRATAVNTATLSGQQGWQSVIVVSQWFHLTRCRLAFHQEAAGLKLQVAAADFMEWRDLFSVAREFPAFYQYLFTGASNTAHP